MNRLQINMIASGLAAFYGVCAILGYGLHGFVAADASHCTEMACGHPVDTTGAWGTAVDSCCRHNHSGPDFHHVGDRTERSGPAVESRKRQHDPETCPACALLAQLRAGYAAVDLPREWSHPPVEFELEYDSAFSCPSMRLGEPRGPPRQTV
jgi:hypothetical protein